MSRNSPIDAEFLLRKALGSYGAALAINHPWVWEGERWQELVFALLAQVSDLPEDEVRVLAEQMQDLDLLDVLALAALRRGRPSADRKALLARRVVEILEEGGFSSEQAIRGLEAICEAALGFEEHFGGKVQDYLRRYGDLMLQELGRFFEFSALNDSETQTAFSYWLQNVLNMPISLLDADMRAFCEQHGLQPEELIAAADELDLNLALLDDLVQHVMSERALAEETE